MSRENHRTPDATARDKDGYVYTLEYKVGKASPGFYDRINYVYYILTGESLKPIANASVRFDEFTGEATCIPKNGDKALVANITRTNNIQWLLCKEVFASSPNKCSYAEIDNEYEALNYFGKDPNEDGKKMLLNTRRRVNAKMLMNFQTLNVIDYSGGEYWLNRDYR